MQGGEGEEGAIALLSSQRWRGEGNIEDWEQDGENVGSGEHHLLFDEVVLNHFSLSP